MKEQTVAHEGAWGEEKDTERGKEKRRAKIRERRGEKRE